MRYIPVHRFGKDHSPSLQNIKVGSVTIAHLKKDNACQMYWYCLKVKPDRKWFAFDVRNLPEFDLLEFEAISFWIDKLEFVAKYFKEMCPLLPVSNLRKKQELN